MKKIPLVLSLFVLALSLFTNLPYAATADFTKWGLPDGAIARLGKGGSQTLAISPDGALLAVASQLDIWIYDIQTSEELTILTGHTGRVNRVAFSPDGRTLVSGDDNKTLRLWDVNKRTEIGILEEHSGGPNTILFSPDVMLRMQYIPTDFRPNTILFSPDGSVLVSRDDDYTLRIWDVDTQSQIRTLEGFTGSLESVSFSPDGKMIATGGQDEVVRLWDFNTLTEVGTLEGHTYTVNSVSFSPGGKTIVTGSNDHTVRLWDVATQTEVGILEGHTYAVNSVVFSPDSKTIVSSSVDGTVRLWNVATQTEIGILRKNSVPILNVSFSPDGRTVAYRTGSNWLRFLDVNKQTITNKYNFFAHRVYEDSLWEVLWIAADLVPEHQENIYAIRDEHIGHAVVSVSFSPDGKTIAASRSDNPFYRYAAYYTYMWDVATLTEIDTLTYPWGDRSFSGYRSPGIPSVSFSPDGKTILTGCGNDICLRNAHTYTEIRRLEIPSHWVSIAVFSPDGHTLAIVGIYGTEFVRLWDVATDTEIGRLWEHIGQVQSVSFSPDGRTLATAGSIDGTVRLWDVDTQTQITILRGHTGWLNSVAFSPDGKTIVSGSNDRTVRLWDVDTLTEITKLEGHTDAVNSVAFNPDGKTIVSGSSDTTVRLWDFATQTGMGTLK